MLLRSLHSDRIIARNDKQALQLLDKGYRLLTDDEKEVYLVSKGLNLENYNLVLFCPQVKFFLEKKQNHFGFGSLFCNFYDFCQRNKIALSSLPHKFKIQFNSISVLELDYYVNRKAINIVKTNYEGETLPENVVKKLNKFDYVATGRQFYVDIFKKSGVIKPIFVLNDLIDRRYFEPVKREKNKVFTFLHYNAGEFRKNTENLIISFLSEFRNEKNVKLILKNSGIGQPAYFDFIKTLNDDRIEIINEKLSVEEMIKLSQRSDCFVFPSRGEGYGLPVIEMMATGLPCIVSNNSAFSHFPDDIYLPVKTSHMIQGRYAYKGTRLWQPDSERLRQQLRFAFENQEKLKKIGQKARKYVLENENEETFKKQFFDMIDKIKTENNLK